ncbi:MAG: TIGR02757 family protein [bacterium]|nr:TIGR02757 family protein [bacterium]
MGAQPEASILKRRLDALRDHYDAAFLDSDPLGMVHAFSRPADREVAGFFAAALAFGNAVAIRKTLGKIFRRLGDRPAERLRTLPHGESGGLFRGIVHRWVRPSALDRLAHSVGGALRTHGSLEALFMEGYDPAEKTLHRALSVFRSRLLHGAEEGAPAMRKGTRAALCYLLPDPAAGSACKRFHLFLRWMVRPADGLDLGLWQGVRPDQLTIPLDTHIARIGGLLGLSERTTPNRKMAEEITDALRRFDPADPVRYDFAICRMGILGHCPRRRDDRL